MKALFKYIGLATLVALCACSSGAPKADKTIGNWQVMTSGEKSALLCYAGTNPISSSTLLEKRDQPYLMVTRRQSGKIEVSASSGYRYKKGSKVRLVIDKQLHTLFFRGNVAWVRSDIEDKDVLSALKTAKTIEVHGVAETGVTSVDTYSAAGFADALVRVRKLCP